MFHATPSIVLRRIPYGEADQIVTFLCREQGRLSGLAKGARKSMRRFGGGLEPGSIVTMHYLHRSGSSLVRLESLDLKSSSFDIARSLERLEAASEAIELALAFLQEHQPEKEKFDFLERYLVALQKKEVSPSERASFLHGWLSLSGYAPVLDRCASCRRPANGDGACSFSAEVGGLLCPLCDRPGVLPVDRSSRKAIDSLLGRSLRGNEEGSPNWERVMHLLREQVHYILGRPLKSPLLGGALI